MEKKKRVSCIVENTVTILVCYCYSGELNLITVSSEIFKNVTTVNTD